MDKESIELQCSFAAKGRFIPYIGCHYKEGLNCYNQRIKIIVIGPRHYCDGVHSSRNVLIGLNNESLSKLERGKPFPAIFKVGCTKNEVEGFLLEECHHEGENSLCPVYEGKICPLRDTCDIRQKLNCKGNRRLRCETLYAVYESARKNKSGIPAIESARLGKHYFGQLTDFIQKQFEPVRKESIWDSIAFFNLIQRYIPLKKVDSDSCRIEKYIKDEDLKAAEEIINALAPGVIITTMSCVENKLDKILGSLGYRRNSNFELIRYSIFEKHEESYIGNKHDWKKYLDEEIESAKIEEIDSYNLRVFFQKLIERAKSKYNADIGGRSSEKRIRMYILDNYGDRIRSKHKCFVRGEDMEKRQEAMRQWLRYNRRY